MANSSSHSRLSRRQLTSTAAWAAPAIVLASAAPAVAASGSGGPQLSAQFVAMTDVAGALHAEVQVTVVGEGSLSGLSATVAVVPDDGQSIVSLRDGSPDLWIVVGGSSDPGKAMLSFFYTGSASSASPPGVLIFDATADPDTSGTVTVVVTAQYLGGGTTHQLATSATWHFPS